MQQIDDKNEQLREIVKYYELTPEFLGISITSIHERSSMDNTLLHMASFAGNARWVKVLVEAGADVNARGDIGNTPLHDACLGDNSPIIEFLIESGADPKVRNEFSETPLAVARIGEKLNAIRSMKELGITE